jgi:thymus-specific serine protease
LNFQNLQFLSLDQGIEDLANFIRTQRATIPGAANSGVILVGASYAATMVSWFRQRYPELVRGSWASGGPLYAEADFGAYNEVVGYSVGVVSGNACHDRIARAFSQMGALVDAGNFARLDSEFNTCRSLSVANHQDIWNFFDMLSNMMASIVQNHW